MNDIYEVKVITEDVNGKTKEFVEKIEARNDLQAIDKVYRHYHKKLNKKIIDIEVV